MSQVQLRLLGRYRHRSRGSRGRRRSRREWSRLKGQDLGLGLDLVRDGRVARCLLQGRDLLLFRRSCEGERRWWEGRGR